jgi:hypothetical protein
MKGATKRLAIKADVPTFYLVADPCDYQKNPVPSPLPMTSSGTKLCRVSVGGRNCNIIRFCRSGYFL